MNYENKKSVCLWVDQDELNEMMEASKVYKAGPAILTLARKGVGVERGDYVPRRIIDVREV